MNFSFSRNVVPTALALLASACVTGGGGGGGGGFVGIGGAEGSTCDKNSVNQGCYGNSVMHCDGTTNSWKKDQDCPSTTTCQEDVATKLAACKATSTNTGTDATSGTDTTTTGGGSDTTTSGGTDANVQAILSCMQSKCSSQWSACNANANCKSTLDCMVACGGTCDPQTCIKTADQTAMQLFSAVGACGNSAGCLGSASVCGNGKCDSGESTSTCPSDCKTPNQTVCGNGTCESGETASNCPSDCKTTVAVCGNGTCESGESKSNCPSDCGGTTCTPDCSGKYCGDSDTCGGKCSGPCSNGGTCTSSKTCTTPKPVCGNGNCESGETASSCPSDCGGGSAQCGNLICEAGENTTNCNQDCDPATVCVMNACADPVMSCLSDSKCGTMYQCVAKCNGNNTCAQSCASAAGSAATSLFSAMAQCINGSGCSGGTTPQCGNGACESGETASNCPADCGGGSGGNPCDSACGKQAPMGCWCDSACKQNGDCCDATGQGTDKTCVGSTCAQCK